MPFPARLLSFVCVNWPLFWKEGLILGCSVLVTLKEWLDLRKKLNYTHRNVGANVQPHQPSVLIVFLTQMRVVQYIQIQSLRTRVALTRVHRTGASQFARDLTSIQQSIVDDWGGKCRQTDFIGCDGDGLPFQESIGLPRVSSRETYISKYTAKYSWGGGRKCRQTDSIGSDGDELPWQELIGGAWKLTCIENRCVGETIGD